MYIEVTGSYLSLGGSPVILPTPGFILIAASSFRKLPYVFICLPSVYPGEGQLPEDTAHLACLRTALLQHLALTQ